MIVPKITEAVINSVKFPEGARKIELRDQEVRGFILEMTAAGNSTFAFRGRSKVDGKQFCIKIGSRPAISVAQARATALQLRAELELGANPRKEKNDEKAVLTVRTFYELHYAPYVRTRKRSWNDDANRYWQHIDGRFGDRKLNTLTRKEIVDFHSALRALGLAPATCDRFLSLFRHMLNLAVQWGFLSSNPATKVPLYLIDNRIENYISDVQLSSLLAVLQSYHNPVVARLIMLLLSCGARLNEMVSLEWKNVDIEQKVLLVSAVNSKSKRSRAIPLNSTALAVLNDQQPDISKRTGRVFISAKTGAPIRSIQRAWSSIRTSAGLPFLRLHDLRHLYASMLVNAGRSLYEVQQVLGHSSPNITQRYAHLTTRTLQDAAATASARIDAAMPTLLPPPDATLGLTPP